MVKQLSVFLENREGRIKDVLEILATNDINLVAISLADTSEYGLLRMIVSDPEKAQRVLKERNVSAMLTDVICIRVPHAVGSLYKAMKALEDAKKIRDLFAGACQGLAIHILELSPVFVAQGGPKCVAIQYIER